MTERKAYYQQHYEKNKAKKKAQALARYQAKKEQVTIKPPNTAKDIKVLMNFKTYTELSKEKQQMWLDFI